MRNISLCCRSSGNYTSKWSAACFYTLVLRRALTDRHEGAFCVCSVQWHGVTTLRHDLFAQTPLVELCLVGCVNLLDLFEVPVEPFVPGGFVVFPGNLFGRNSK